MKISGLDKVQETLEKGGLKDTMKKRDMSQKLFQEFLHSKDLDSVEDLLFPMAGTGIPDYGFFDGLRTNKGEFPPR